MPLVMGTTRDRISTGELGPQGNGVRASSDCEGYASVCGVSPEIRSTYIEDHFEPQLKCPRPGPPSVRAAVRKEHPRFFASPSVLSELSNNPYSVDAINTPCALSKFRRAREFGILFDIKCSKKKGTALSIILPRKYIYIYKTKGTGLNTSLSRLSFTAKTSRCPRYFSRGTLIVQD